MVQGGRLLRVSVSSLVLVATIMPTQAAVWWCAVSQDSDLKESPTIPITTPFQGPQMGNTLTIGHQAGTAASWPTVFVLYSSGYIRMQPACVPDGKLGTSYVLGPAYWFGPNEGDYAHHPLLSSITMTGDLETGSVLTINADGVVGDFTTHYTLRVFTPTARRMECKVIQSAVCHSAFGVDTTRQTEHQGFKLTQLSSYYCDPLNNDANTFLCLGASGYHRLPLSNTEGLVDPAPEPLARNRVELVGCGAQCWEGFKPNAVITLAGGVPLADCTAQGNVRPGTVPDEHNVAPDNVGAWINWDRAPKSFSPGMAPPDVTYRLTAQTSPQPQSWAPLGDQIARDAPLKLVFDLPMRKSLLQSKFSITPSVTGKFSWPDASTLVFTPSVPLVPETTYRVRLQKGATPTDGHPAAAALGWVFRTVPAAPPPPPALVATMTVQTARQPGAALVVNLSAAATVEVAIHNLAGRLVARLASQDLPSGGSTLLWDGRSNALGGTRTPPGAYLVRLTARNSSGQQAQSLARLDLRH